MSPAGLIPPDGILTLSERATHRTTVENSGASRMDTLDRAFVIFRHVANGTTRPRDIYRRVDLVVTRWPSWGSALVAWTGSTMFNRDLRIHAKSL